MNERIRKLSVFWKVLYYIWVLKFIKKQSIFEEWLMVNCIMIRFLHPVWFIYFLTLIMWFWATKGFLNKEILEIREHFVLI